jgi:two-component system response regulator MprA
MLYSLQYGSFFMALILVVGDSQVTAPLTQALTTSNHQVLIAHDCASAQACIQSQLPDAIVIDWSACGGERMNRVRALLTGNPPPTLVVSTPSSVEERIRALESGVDDYLVKPFELTELQARVQALLRRRPFTVRPSSLLQYEDLLLNLTTRDVHRSGRRLFLTPTEFQLLMRLLEQPEQVRTRTELIRDVWGQHMGCGWNNLNVYIRELRRKLEEAGEPRLIHTVRGVGYVLRASSSSPDTLHHSEGIQPHDV